MLSSLVGSLAVCSGSARALAPEAMPLGSSQHSANTQMCHVSVLGCRVDSGSSTFGPIYRAS